MSTGFRAASSLALASALAVSALAWIGCSSPSTQTSSSSGGASAAVGGKPATGGAVSANSGGKPATGGASANSGGTSATGGASTNSGGKPATGGGGSSNGSGGTSQTGGSPGATCPAPAPNAQQFVVYGEEVAPNWAAYGFQGNFAAQSTTVCSGTQALQYQAHQYDGVAFDTPEANAISAKHLSIRVHVNVASDWAFAAVTVGQTDPHQFIGEVVLAPGWQVLEFDIPSTTPMTRWLLLEKQDMGNATLTVDDVRLGL